MSKKSSEQGDATGVFATRIGLLTLGGLFAVNAVSLDGPIVAVTDIADSFGTSRGEAQLTIVLFLLGYTIGHLPAGLLGDRYGRRPIILIGLSLAFVMSLVAVFAPNFETLMIARFLQGMMTCTAGLLSRAIIRDIANGQQASRITGNALSCLAVLIIVAPLLSGLWLTMGGWRAVLLQVSIYLAVMLVLTVLLVPETMKVDKQGAHPWAQFKFSLAAFFACKQSVLASWLGGIAFATYFIFATTGASLFKDVYGFSGAVFGVAFAGIAIVQFFAAQFNTRAVTRIGSHRVLRIACLFSGVATALCIFMIGLNIAPFYLVMLMAVCFSISHGLVLPNSIALALDPLPKTAGFSAAIHGMIQTGVSAALGFFVALVYDGTAQMIITLFAGSGLVTLGSFYLSRKMLETDRLHP